MINTHTHCITAKQLKTPTQKKPGKIPMFTIYVSNGSCMSPFQIKNTQPLKVIFISRNTDCRTLPFCTTTLQPLEKVGILLERNYTYQRALNVTSPSDGGYNNQLPYTPRISGSLKAKIITTWINISYSLLWTGHRYAVNQNYAESRLPPYYDHSISDSRNLQYKKTVNPYESGNTESDEYEL